VDEHVRPFQQRTEVGADHVDEVEFELPGPEG
jgi:hypothetical protein